MKRIGFVFVAVIGLFMAKPALADNWDQAACTFPGCNDSFFNTTTTELVHGNVQTHDLDDTNSGLVDDEDWYFISLKPYTSYEVVVDSTTPYMNQSSPVSLSLVDSGGNIDTSDYAVSSRGFSRSLRVGNSTGTVNDDRWVRVTAPTDCAGVCDTRDQYTIRALETTYYAPRFNNSGSQVSVLVVQNPTGSSVSGNVYFWSAAGVLLNTTPLSIGPKSATVLNTSTVVPASSGSITISHNSPYGAVSGKIVAVEPATGFTFDTTLVPRYN